MDLPETPLGQMEHLRHFYSLSNPTNQTKKKDESFALEHSTSKHLISFSLMHRNYSMSNSTLLKKPNLADEPKALVLHHFLQFSKYTQQTKDITYNRNLPHPQFPYSQSSTSDIALYLEYRT